LLILEPQRCGSRANAPVENQASRHGNWGTKNRTPVNVEDADLDAALKTNVLVASPATQA
jgi:hypothetical protein